MQTVCLCDTECPNFRRNNPWNLSFCLAFFFSAKKNGVNVKRVCIVAFMQCKRRVCATPNVPIFVETTRGIFLFVLLFLSGKKKQARHSRRFALKKPCSRKGGVLPSAPCYQHPTFSGPFPTCFIRGAGKYGRSASCFRDKRTPVSEWGFINTNHTRRAGRRRVAADISRAGSRR